MSCSRMPALFLGHGSPMNALEDNVYTCAWHRLGKTLPRPRAIVAISAHWMTAGIQVTAMAQPPTIHDFRGFPRALYDIDYPAPGAPWLAARLAKYLAPEPVTTIEQGWGLDHGCWGVLIKMYPDADIPVVQLSIDASRPGTWHLALGRKLAPLRDQGIMLVASGNTVHNLRMAQWQGEAKPLPWAEGFDEFVAQYLAWQGPDDRHPLANFLAHPASALACPTPEHFLPLLYILGSWDSQEAITVPTSGIVMGSLSMMSVQIG